MTKTNILPYASSVGAPVIKETDISSWKIPRVKMANDHFNQRYNELKEQYEELVEECLVNDLIYNAEFNFEPIIGKTYYLYKRKDGSTFLSIISFEEMISFEERNSSKTNKLEYIGSYVLETTMKWRRV